RRRSARRGRGSRPLHRQRALLRPAARGSRRAAGTLRRSLAPRQEPRRLGRLARRRHPAGALNPASAPERSAMKFAEQGFVAAVNHVLVRSPWALERLLPFAGCAFRIDASPVRLDAAIASDGLLVEAPAETEPEVTL